MTHRTADEVRAERRILRERCAEIQEKLIKMERLDAKLGFELVVIERTQDERAG